MLARRLTLVCLLITLFGMGLSMLVAETGRTDRRNWTSNLYACSPYCALPAR